MPSIQVTAPPIIRKAVKDIYVELTGFALSRRGPLNAHREDELYTWARSIFSGLSTGGGTNTHPHGSLAALRDLVEGAASGVRNRRNEPRDQVIDWLLSNYSLRKLQDISHIPVCDAAQDPHHPAPSASHHAAPTHQGPVYHHHGVSLSPPVVPTSRHAPFIPPILPGVDSPRLPYATIRLPPIITREEEEEDRSLSKARRSDAHLGYGSFMTPRKAGIYGLIRAL